MGMFRVFQGKRRRNFSAVQTAWRRGRHSNRRYNSLSRRSRRVRSLRGSCSIKHTLRLHPSPQSCQPVRFGDEFERRVPGNNVVEGGPRSAPVQESGFASITAQLAAVTRPNFSPAAPTLPHPDFWPRINSREACPGRDHGTPSPTTQRPSTV